MKQGRELEAASGFEPLKNVLQLGASVPVDRSDPEPRLGGLAPGRRKPALATGRVHRSLVPFGSEVDREPVTSEATRPG